jgi:hypothetical protein
MKHWIPLLKLFGVVIFTWSGIVIAETSPKWIIPLNHFYLVVDSDTYKAIENSEFLKNSFGVWEQRTTVRTDMTYTGFYFYGAHTYFEFFDVATRKNDQIGDSGIAFGMDQPGTLKLAAKEAGWTDPSIITREVNGQQVSWFWIANPQKFPENSVMSVWGMEYDPQFLKDWHPEVQDQNQGISRSAILSRYSNFLKQDPAKRLMSDVVALTIAVDDQTRDALAGYCRAFGYVVKEDGEAVIADGPDIVLRFVKQTDKSRGIQKIDFKLNGKPDQPQYKFGSSILTFESNNHAAWSFSR